MTHHTAAEVPVPEVPVPAAPVPEVPVPEVPTPAQVDVAAETFRMLSSTTRLFIVWHLLHGERDVSSVAAECGVSVQVVSQHLAKMRSAGLVSSRRDGKHIFYIVDDPHVVTMVSEIFDHIAPDGSLAPDPEPRTAAPLRTQTET